MLDDPPNMIDLINVLFIPFVQIIPSGHLNHLCSLCHGDIPPSLMVVLQFFHHQPLDTCQVSTQFLLCPSVSQRKMSTHSSVFFLSKREPQRASRQLKEFPICAAQTFN